MIVKGPLTLIINLDAASRAILTRLRGVFTVDVENKDPSATCCPLPSAIYSLD